MKPAMIVTDSSQHERLSWLTLDTVLFNLDTDLDISNHAATQYKYNNRIAILNTSGSSGNPKYVQIQNKSIVRLVKNTNYFSISEKDVVAHIASYSFDVSLVEIWGALANGATLLIVPHEYLLDCKLRLSYSHITIYLYHLNYSVNMFIKTILVCKVKILFIGG